MTGELERKWRTRTIATSILAVVLAGCGGGGSTPPPPIRDNPQDPPQNPPQNPPEVPPQNPQNPPTAPGTFTIAELSVGGDPSDTHILVRWGEAAGAERYSVELRPSLTEGFIPWGTDRPATDRQLAIASLPLYRDWNAAAVRISACNAIGCTTTAEAAFSPLFLAAYPVHERLHEQVPEFFAAGFGTAMAVSHDGKTLAVLAPAPR
jgi:hypothetical protein